jgi:hypothetical protein
VTEFTADTITDEQIRELRDRRLYPAYWAGNHDTWNDINTCRIALVDREPHARARCAEIINARSGK